jgi:hypothetical protein
MSDPDIEAMLIEVLKAEQRIEPLLHGLGPEIQGAVLCALTATWLGGFKSPKVRKFQAELFEEHIRMLLRLTKNRAKQRWTQ